MEEIKDLDELKKIELNILLFVDKVCKENDIQYSLAFGTALGAVRHKGFIPWDDDIDIAMTRPNYNKLLNILDNLNDKNFKCLHFGDAHPDYYFPYAKVVDLNTTLKEDNLKGIKDYGVWIDIFPVDKVPNKGAKKAINKCKNYQTLACIVPQEKFKKSKTSSLASFLKLFVYPIAKMHKFSYWLKKAEKIQTKHNLEDCDFVADYNAHLREKAKLPKSFFEELTEIEFEGHKFPIVKDYDKYLTILYGDYMKLPPEEKRVSAHDFVAYKK